MNNLRNQCTGRWPVHFCRNGGIALAALTLAATPLSAAAAADVASAPAAAPASPPNAGPGVVGQGVADFYKARRNAPLWLSPQAGDAAQQLLSLLSSASVDGLDINRYRPVVLSQLLSAARNGKRKDVERADVALSQAFSTYAWDMARDPGVGITYVDPSLWRAPPSPLASLLNAASAPSLTEYVQSIGWMHPIYGQLRTALAERKFGNDQQRQMLELNLKRARALPAGKDRYVLVNAAQQRLFMYDGGKPVDSMVVVVGKPKWQTPMLTAYIRYAALNPYWYVPPDLAGEDVGQFVVKQGLPYLDKMGYEVVSDWAPGSTIIDPKTIDWKGVVDGKVEVMIRQKPGPQNFMGRMKFMFPNQFGVYLHDNPRRELFLKSTRYFSGGCVRLEDAARLGRWLFGRDLDWRSASAEQPVPLAQPVPVYIT
ncbi:MAG: L,D-transpeptidase family protein, partial [Sphingomicrobium sp.]